MTTYYELHDTAVGELLLMSEGGALTDLHMTAGKYVPAAAKDWQRKSALSVFEQTKRELDAYFAGQLREFTVPLAPRGSVVTFPSLRAGRAFVLNDLYIDIAARRLGLARALLQAATDFARTDGAIRLELETDPDNRSAQALYRHMGWEAYEGTLRFRLSLSG